MVCIDSLKERPPPIFQYVSEEAKKDMQIIPIIFEASS